MTTVQTVPLINTFIIGVMKSGTTSLARLLRPHPDICLCDGKEAHIFDRPKWQDARVPDEVVAQRFTSFRGQKVVLDATPIYIFAPGALEAILRYNPAARFILILRSPVDRTISHYGHTVTAGGEKRSLLVALLSERWRLWRESKHQRMGPIFRNRSYVSRSLYFRQVHHLLSLTDQVLFVNFRDLVTNTPETISRICDFMGISADSVQTELPRLNSRTLEKPFRLGRALLAMRFSRDTRKTERLLGWSKYSLASSRSFRR